MLPDEEDWIALALLAGIGPVCWGEIMRGERDAATVAALCERARRELPRSRINGLRRWCRDHDTTLLTPAAEGYPALLRMLPDPPAMLFLRGAASWLARPQIAVVGARHASRRGLADAAWLGEELTRVGLLVTSGLALGIDGAAHEAALAAGGGTVAVLGSGVDRVYPRRHRELAARIAAQGALLSEFLPGTTPLPHHFPRRNRLISGLSLGVVVVEAAERSGSLITARLAAAQGRDVFAMPATARDPGGAGCHRLLREGARLLTRIEDVLEELPAGVLAELTAERSAAGAPDLEVAAIDPPRQDPLLELFDADGSIFDQLLLRSGLDAASLQGRLLELELDGHIAREQQRWVRLH